MFFNKMEFVINKIDLKFNKIDIKFNKIEFVKYTENSSFVWNQE